MKLFHTKRAMQGFSLIEILVVTSITLTVSAIAIPKMMTALANMELRGAIHTAAGIVQQTRMQAIKEDTFRKTKYYNSTGGGLIYEDLNDDGTPQSTEPQALLGNTVLAYSAPTGIPAMSSTDLGYTPTTTTTVAFSTTGQPCTALHTCAVGMVIYFTDTRRMGNPGWAAVSIAPAGRVATWIWTGTAWMQA